MSGKCTNFCWVMSWRTELRESRERRRLQLIRWVSGTFWRKVATQDSLDNVLTKQWEIRCVISLRNYSFEGFIRVSQLCLETVELLPCIVIKTSLKVGVSENLCQIMATERLKPALWLNMFSSRAWAFGVSHVRIAVQELELLIIESSGIKSVVAYCLNPENVSLTVCIQSN